MSVKVITLALDASTYVGTIALWRGDALVAEGTAAMRGAHEERLMPEVRRVLDEGHVKVHELSRVICGAGPGSFTSLRIAASIAKGLAFGVDAELYAVSSLGLIVTGGPAARQPEPGRYFACLDALRGEHYLARYDVATSGRVGEIGSVGRVPSSALQALADRENAVLMGPGLTINEAPHARGALALLGDAPPVPLDAWEPSYGRLAEAQVKWEAAHGRPLSPG